MEQLDCFIGLKLPHKLAQEVRRRANEEDRSASAIVRRVLRAALEREDENSGGNAKQGE